MTKVKIYTILGALLTVLAVAAVIHIPMRDGSGRTANDNPGNITVVFASTVQVVDRIEISVRTISGTDLGGFNGDRVRLTEFNNKSYIVENRPAYIFRFERPYGGNEQVLVSASGSITKKLSSSYDSIGCIINNDGSITGPRRSKTSGNQKTTTVSCKNY